MGFLDRFLAEQRRRLKAWASDPELGRALAVATPAAASRLESRLASFRRFHPSTLEVWVIAASGRIVARNGAGPASPAVERDVADEGWFREALADLHPGKTVQEVLRSPSFVRPVALQAAAIRDGGRSCGVLAIFGDWQKEFHAALDRLDMTEREKNSTRCLILDGRSRTIASDGAEGVSLRDFPFPAEAGKNGSYRDRMGRFIGYARSAECEWSTVLVQNAGASRRPDRVPYRLPSLPTREAGSVRVIPLLRAA